MKRLAWLASGCLVLLVMALLGRFTARAYSQVRADVPRAISGSAIGPRAQGASLLATTGPLWRLGGAAHSVAVQGEYAYLAQGMRLAVVNLTTEEVEGAVHFDHPVRDIAVSGDYAYVVTSTYGDLHIVDIGDSANPQLRGDTKSISWGGGEGVAVKGDYVYVICQSPTDGLFVFNVSDPDAPSLAKQITGVYGRWVRLGQGEDYLYVLAWGSLSIYDIGTDPTNPDPKGQVSVSNAENLWVDEPYVYVTGGAVWPGVYVLDVSNADSPHEEDFWSMTYTGDTLGVAALDDYLYVGYNPNFWGTPYPSVRILDVSQPLTVTQAAYYDRFSGLYSFVISGTVLHIAGGDDGDLISLDLTTRTAPSESMYLEQPGYTEKVRVAGDRAYVVVRSDHRGVRNGLWVYDLSDPLSPVEADKEDWLGDITDLTIAEPYVYMSGGSGLCLRIRHMDDVWTPVGSSGHENTCYGVAVKSPAAYLVVPNQGLDVLDVSDPTDPLYKRTVSVPDLPYAVWSRVAVDGNRAYVWRPGKFYALDVSTPLYPTLVVTHELPGLTTLYPQGDYVYAGTSSGLSVLDVKDLQDIHTEDSYATLNAVSGVDVDNYVAYISGSGFVHALDVTYPQTLTLMATYQYSGRVRGADIQGMGPLALVADEDLGLTLHALLDGVASPDGGDPGAVMPWESLVVTFARPMNTGSVTYSCTPNPGGWQASWGGSAGVSTQAADSRVLTLTHNPFTPGQDYTFTVLGGQTAEGDPISSFSLTFSAAEGYRVFVPLVLKNF